MSQQIKELSKERNQRASFGVGSPLKAGKYMFWSWYSLVGGFNPSEKY